MAGVSSNAMQQMLQMRMSQPQPNGPGQQLPMGGPSQPPGAPQDPMAAQDPSAPPGGAQGPLDAMNQAGLGQGNEAALMAFLPILQKLTKGKLKVADMKKGKAELVGPTQEQFLGAAAAKHHGAKEHHVRNRGRGQRLHVSF